MTMQISDLISRDSVLKGIEELQKSPWYNAGKEPNRDFPYPHLEYLARKEAVQVIRDLCIKKESTVDAEPVRHGRYIGTEYDGYADGNIVFYEWVCSECECVFEDEKPMYKYCPNCGARMDGVDNAAD